MHNQNRTLFELAEVEQILQSSLQPVKPRADFLKQLRRRLSEPVATSPNLDRIERNHYLVFGLATLLSGVLIVFTTSRMILAFWGAIGLARYLKNQADQRQLSAQRVLG